jgi:uncharacterized protein YbjT (DUF2867 family)
MRNPTVLIIGGSGFIGSHLVAKLAAAGSRVIVPTRRYERAKHLISLPRVEVVEADPGQDAVLQRLMHGVDAVINLVGLLHSRQGTPYGPDFARAHVELPKRLVAACVAAGVPRYLHMSALGAARDAPSMYLRSKADGELAALANPALATTIFRPSVVFGPEDKFINLFASMQKILPLVPLGGADTRFQPVFVEDVAQAFVNALLDLETRGKIYELAGPDVQTLGQIVALAGKYCGHPRPVFNLPAPLARLQAMLLEWAPGGPLMSRDNLDSMQVDNVIAPSSTALTLADLGIVASSLAAVAPRYLGAVHRGRARFDDFRSRAKR